MTAPEMQPCPCGDNDGHWCSRADCPFERPTAPPEARTTIEGLWPIKAVPDFPKYILGSTVFDWFAAWAYRGVRIEYISDEIVLKFVVATEPIGRSLAHLEIPCRLSIKSARVLRMQLDLAIRNEKLARMHGAAAQARETE